MIVFIVMIWLGFQGLAICILAGLVNMDFNSGGAITAAIVTVSVGATITRAMYLKSRSIKKKQQNYIC